MKDFLIDLVSTFADKRDKINIMREYLQAYTLRALFEKGHFQQLAFVGGTALRLLYALPRFSEDLDFSLVNNTDYNFVRMLDEIKHSFTDAAYSISIKYKDERTVHAALLKFPELLYKAGLTHRKDQNLSIKLDIDTKPPAGGVVERSLVNKYFPITFSHYDLPSLLAGKLHAILTRQYIKGRDYFDLGWILSRHRDIVPNLNLLNNALKQTGHGGGVTAENWKVRISAKLEAADWKIITNDIERFVEYLRDIDTLTPEAIKTLL